MQKTLFYALNVKKKVGFGDITQAEVDASIILAKIAESNNKVEDFTMHSCKKVEEGFVLTLAKNDIMKIRQSRTLYRLLQDQFVGKIWLIEAQMRQIKNS